MGEIDLVVWGTGEHAGVAADLALAAGHRVVATVDPEADRPGGADAPGVALGVLDNRAREACLRRAAERPLPALVHPNAVVSPEARLGRGTLVLARAVVNAAAVVGEGGILGVSAVVEHDCVLGTAVHVSACAVLAGGVQVGDRSWIGPSATIIEGVRIGSDVVVAAGAVVIRDVPDGATVAEVPARRVASAGT